MCFGLSYSIFDYTTAMLYVHVIYTKTGTHSAEYYLAFSWVWSISQIVFFDLNGQKCNFIVRFESLHLKCVLLNHCVSEVYTDNFRCGAMPCRVFFNNSLLVIRGRGLWWLVAAGIATRDHCRSNCALLCWVTIAKTVLLLSKKLT